MERDVVICEMSPRDGLQVVNRAGAVSLDDRVALVETLQSARLPYIEVGAFVSESRVPAMADTAELLARCSRYDGHMAALVPNLRHYERFTAATSLDTVALFVSASESYSQRNTRMSVDAALAAAGEVARAARRDGYRVRAHISGAFRDLGDDDGPTPEAEVERVCRALREGDAAMVLALADTDGHASAEDIERVVSHLAGTVGLEGVGVHLHDGDGTGVERAKAAYRWGVRIFDAAVGGIGGNPTALALAVGNVATEALVRAFEDDGVSTGIEWEALINAGAIVTRMTAAAGDTPPPSVILSRALAARS